MKVAINGFGRIGKQFFLACMEHKVDWEIVINELGSLDDVIYSLKYDSVHPSAKEVMYYEKNYLYFGNKKIKFFSEPDAEKLPWKKEGIDLVVDCTGAFTERDAAMKHIKAGAKKVLLSAPGKNSDVTIVYGVNNSVLKKDHKIISAGSCTTNCVSPLMKVLNEVFKVKEAHFVTVHAYTATQKLIDSIDKKDARRGRAAALSISPSTSGASQSVVESIPELKGKLEGYALRVPVVDGSIATIVALVEKKTSVAEINKIFKKYSTDAMKEVMDYNEDAIVSSDIIHNPFSTIFDPSLTKVVGNTVSIAGWYDNEWGYSNRLVDVAKLVLSK